MKKLIIILLAVSLFNCGGKNNNNLVPPKGSELNGTWQLRKITYGFSQISVTGDKMPYQETLNFNLTGDWSYTQTRDGKVIDQSKIAVATDEKGYPNQLVIRYLEDNTYQVYSLEVVDGKTILNLYQRADSGSVLADGSNYYYEKQ